MHTDLSSDSSYTGDSEDNFDSDSDSHMTRTLTKQHLPLKKTNDEKADSDKAVKIGLTMNRNNKRVSTKNTLVQGAKGCIIGDNIQIITNKANDVPVDPKVKNLEEQTGKILANYIRESELFLKTKAYKVIKEELESLHFITLTGRPGDGKTFMALQILLEHKSTRQCFILESPEMWDTIAGLNTERIALVDDVFGTYIYDELKAKAWISRFENMEKLLKQENGKLRIIFTSRAYIVEDVKPFLEKCSIFRNHCIINLSSKEFEMSESEKRGLFKMHLKYKDLPVDDEAISVIVSANPPHGFPHCVRLFTTNHFQYTKAVSFFKIPSECLSFEIERFRLFDQKKFCVLVLMAMHEGKVSASLFNDLKPKSDFIKALISLSGLPDSTPFSVLKNALLSLLFVYVRQTNNGTFVFAHESISEVVCYSIAKLNPIVAIEKMDLKFLNKLIKTKSLKKERNVCIYNDMYLELWKRLLKEIRSGNVRQAMKHRAWEDINFVRVWEDLEANTCTEKLDTEFLVWLKGVKDMVYERSVFYWAVFYSKQAFVDYILLNTIDEKEADDEMSVTLMTACFNGLTIDLLHKIIGKGGNIDHTDSDNEFTKCLQDFCVCDDSDDYKDTPEWLEYAFGEAGITPLQAATLGGNVEVVNFLLAAGSKIEKRQNSGKTAIRFAAMKDNTIIQTVLLESIQKTCKRLIVNMGDREGKTALHYATSQKMVSILLKHQADASSQDNKGRKPSLKRNRT